jgi:trehalose synthase-fused probable maltokinase
MASSAPRSSRDRPPASEAVAAALERFVAEWLPAALPRQRWFGSQGRRIVAARLRDLAPLGPRAPGAWWSLVDVEFERGADETYALPLLVCGDTRAPEGTLGHLEVEGVPGLVADALGEPSCGRALLAAIGEDLTVRSRRGVIRFLRAAAFPAGGALDALTPKRLEGEQSNTSVVYGDALILKAFRRIAPGTNLEREMTGFLTARARFPHVPQLAGAVEYLPAGGEAVTLAVLHRFTPNRGDGWRWALGHLAQLRDFVAVLTRHEPLEPWRLGELVRDFSAGTVAGLRLLGALTGALHAALAGAPDDPAFAAEPISSEDVARWTGRIAADLGLTLEMLRASLPTLPAPARGRGQALLAAGPALHAPLDGLAPLALEGCCKLRVHGDYHLGQTLRTDDGFVILDFEGEPVRPPEERRARQCALKDVAGMLRSFDYAVATALGEEEAPSAVGDAWRRLAVEAFLDGYLPAAAKAPVRLAPLARPALDRALAVFELDKALYEVRYELDHRPAWVDVPLRGLARLLVARPAPPWVA